mmetsp:Transcript_16492/g.51626  ORF Transcript_16492/g.51626 Transcript_16492/m.51626 type:complete len:268 (-) Transcript_16492:435-1238(-)
MHALVLRSLHCSQWQELRGLELQLEELPPGGGCDALGRFHARGVQALEGRIHQLRALGLVRAGASIPCKVGQLQRLCCAEQAIALEKHWRFVQSGRRMAKVFSEVPAVQRALQRRQDLFGQPRRAMVAALRASRARKLWVQALLELPELLVEQASVVQRLRAILALGQQEAWGPSQGRELMPCGGGHGLRGLRACGLQPEERLLHFLHGGNIFRRNIGVLKLCMPERLPAHDGAESRLGRLRQLRLQPGLGAAVLQDRGAQGPDRIV